MWESCPRGGMRRSCHVIYCRENAKTPKTPTLANFQNQPVSPTFGHISMYPSPSCHAPTRPMPDVRQCVALLHASRPTLAYGKQSSMGSSPHSRCAPPAHVRPQPCAIQHMRAVARTRCVHAILPKIDRPSPGLAGARCVHAILLEPTGLSSASPLTRRNLPHYRPATYREEQGRANQPCSRLLFETQTNGVDVEATESESPEIGLA